MRKTFDQQLELLSQELTLSLIHISDPYGRTV